MGLFGKLKKALGGDDRPPADDGLYLYIKLDRTGEVVRLRLTPQYELVPDYDAGGYVTRKTIVGPATFARADAEFRFDEGRSLIGEAISGGALVDEAAYDAWEAARRAQAQPAEDEPTPPPRADDQPA